MRFDPLAYPYPSRRNCVYAARGVVATSQPLAAQAGLAILQQGGNAVDAAVATAAMLTVVEPTSNGLGSDAFALIWSGGKLHGLNSSGPAPHLLSAESLLRAGLAEIPRHGFIPAMVPGAPAAWVELNRRFGRLPLAQVLAPAVEYAERGYPISPTLGRSWQDAFTAYRKSLDGEVFRPWFETFAPGGRAPAIGEIWRSPAHARTLRLIAETSGEAFYRGELAERIDAFSRQHGGFLRADDLAAFRPQWVEPISVHYRGYDVWELPPNGQGLVALLALNILKGFDFAAREDVETYHRQIEALKLAFADGRQYIADPAAMDVAVADLLSDAYADERRRLIGPNALEPAAGRPPRGGTVYLAAADGEGNMVSYIQSNYMGFGSGIVIPETGIALNNRGCCFSLEPGHPNRLEPGKRPYNTIIPGFLTRAGQPVGPFGVMGGFMQPQGHLQVIMNTLDFALNPQAALDAPRWRWLEGRTVELEHTVPAHIADALARCGHDVRWALGSEGFGRGQIIWRQEGGVLAAGTEPRTDGHVAAW
ncbi:MAG: gamma-glutamyltransferase family protein [Symbiobacterium sp.]|uniref:gamma-glutamyltransferase family protein n=1 Tax=Symbiobacterium sp. TaxID=1971213 RepID=UPI003464BA62